MATRTSPSLSVASSERESPLSGFRSATVGEIASLLGASFLGDKDIVITGVAGLESAAPGTLAFIDSEKRLLDALDSQAAAFIAPESLRAQLDDVAYSTSASVAASARKPIVLAVNPRLAFAKVLEYLRPQSWPEVGVHPSAVVAATAHLGEGVSIREGCFVGEHARIGDGAVLFPHAYVGEGAQIGDECVLYPSVVVGHHVHIGKRVRVHAGSVIGGDGFGYVFDGQKHQKVPQVGTVIIEDDVEIGCNVCIDRATLGATRVGEGTKIDNLVQIAHNVQIGRNCILCGQVGVSGSVVIEDNVMAGGQVGLRDHVTIGKGAILGAQSGVMIDVGPGVFVMGAPAVAQRDHLRVEAASRKLPETQRQLRALEKKVALLSRKLEALMPDAPAPIDATKTLG